MIIKKSDSDIEITLASGHRVFIDLDDEWILNVFPNWYLRGEYVWCQRYIETEYSSVREQLCLSRLIVFKTAKMKRNGLLVDHKDQDKMNCRKKNLRLCTKSQNGLNVTRATRSNTGYRGVSKSKRNLTRPYSVFIKTAAKRIMLGYFSDPVEAAKAYDKAAKEHYGEFAILNFPETT